MLAYRRRAQLPPAGTAATWCRVVTGQDSHRSVKSQRRTVICMPRAGRMASKEARGTTLSRFLSPRGRAEAWHAACFVPHASFERRRCRLASRSPIPSIINPTSTRSRQKNAP